MDASANWLRVSVYCHFRLLNRGHFEADCSSGGMAALCHTLTLVQLA